ncbi:MAG: sodium ion-translocating decarboxylase subunit beta [Spirochaetes bacterium]|nr:sodium ion-translocating decarboxylase subunit beta [Spirochaetota bacterium]
MVFGILPGELLMIIIGMILLYLGIVKGFEPLLLIPIGFGGILANIPIADMAHVSEVIMQGVNQDGGSVFQYTMHYSDKFLGIIYSGGVASGLFPLLIFMGVGAMTDFGPLLANPKTLLLGAAAQFGIFTTLIGALILTKYFPDVINYSLKDASAIGIIGGADGPTAIYVATKLAPDLLGAIAVAAYSYMALVPIIQPPIMRLLTTKNERAIVMKQLRHVSKREKIVFPLVVLSLCILLLPDATPLIGALMFGNLAKECGVVDRLSDTMQNALINIVTIMLGLSVGSKLAAEKFLKTETLGILALGLAAFAVGTAAGLLLAKVMNLFLKDKINPLIGSAGVSAVPMAARVANKVGQESNPHNFLLMHAMGPNVAGVIGSAVAAGVLIALNL